MGRKKNYISDADISLSLKFEESEPIVLNENFTIHNTSLMSATQIANGFRFSRETIDRKAYQLNMLPVMAYFDEDDEPTSHDSRQIAYGAVLPNSYFWKEIDGEDYFCCKTVLWNSRYPELANIQNANQSIEITGCKGHYNAQDKYYEVEDYDFSCITILNQNVAPAFKKAKMDAQFSDEFEQLKQEIALAFEEYTNNEKKGEDTVGNLENQEVFEEEVQTEVKMEEETQQDEQVFEDEVVEFKLSHEATRDRIFKALNPVDEDGYRSFNYFVCETKDGSFVAMDVNDGLFYRFNYSETDGKVSVDMESKVEAFATFMTQAEMNKLDELKANGEKFSEVNEQFEKLSEQFAQLTSDIEAKDAKIVELEEFKANKEQEELEKFQAQEQAKIAEIKSKFSAKLSLEEIEGAINAEMTSDEVNKALSVTFAQKMLSEETPQTTQVFADISDNTPKIVTNEDRLVEEAKALRNKNIK